MTLEQATVRTERVNLLSLVNQVNAPQQLLLMRLDLYPEAILRTTYADGRVVSYDEVSPADVASALAGLDVGTGVLPPNVLFYRQGSAERVAVYLPAQVRAVRLDGDPGPLTIPWPPLVFLGQGRVYQVFALATGDWPQADTPLCHTPSPNVHTSGNVCQGTVKFPRCSLATVHEAADLFFSSQFNHDLSVGQVSRKHKNVVHLWRELDEAGADTYPLDDLVPTGATLEDLLR